MDLEALLTNEQKAAVVKAAIAPHLSREGLDVEDCVTVIYDRRYSHIFSASRVGPVDGERPPVELKFSITPTKENMATFFNRAAREAAEAVVDILSKRITAATKARPSQMDVTCPCCEAKVRVFT